MQGRSTPYGYGVKGKMCLAFSGGNVLTLIFTYKAEGPDILYNCRPLP